MRIRQTRVIAILIFAFGLTGSGLVGLGCSSPPPMKAQAYAKLSSELTYEEEFPVVWKALEEVLRNYKVVDRDPEEVDSLEMKKITHRSLETDWIYGQSRDKYQEYKVNGSPRKIYLQTRFKYQVEVNRVMGGTKVSVKTQEENERLKADGTSNGFEEADNPDASRPNELLEKIKIAVLAAPVV